MEEPSYVAEPSTLSGKPRVVGAHAAGTPCQGPACRGKRRCRMHGGTNSGGPRGNQHALKHGRYTARAIAERCEARQALQALRQLLAQLKDDAEHFKKAEHGVPLPAACMC